MVRPSEPDGLGTAWRALAGAVQLGGWRTTELVTLGACRILATRRMPEDQEGILVGFKGGTNPPALRLPVGRGFLVEQVREGAPPGFTWTALSCREGADLDLFTTMVRDIVLALRAGWDGTATSPKIDDLLRRIQVWQDFMSRGSGALLGPEEEIGLFGELLVLDILLKHIPDAAVVLECWTGPAGGLQDFVPGNGAIEVKTTVSPSGFRARIDSLEQLDPAVRSPLCVAAVRLSQSTSGATLPEQIERTRRQIAAGDPSAAARLDAKLLQAGYIPEMAVHHVRRFSLRELRLHKVDGSFPSLTSRSVPDGVVAARYVIELDTVRSGPTSMIGFLDAAGFVNEQ